MSPHLTNKQKKQIHDNMEKSKLAKMKFTLEDINEVNPVRKLIITISILSLLTTDSGKENKEIIAIG